MPEPVSRIHRVGTAPTEHVNATLGVPSRFAGIPVTAHGSETSHHTYLNEQRALRDNVPLFRIDVEVIFIHEASVEHAACQFDIMASTVLQDGVSDGPSVPVRFLIF